MRGKTVALLVLALGCGLVAALGITQVLAKRGDSSGAADTTPVYVASADIPMSSIVPVESIKIEQWPKDKVPVGALVKQEDILGRRARYRIFSGQPILDPMLLHPGEVPVDSLIPKGFRVVAIPVGPEAIQGGLVLPGSRCDLQVFIRADASLGIGETVSKTVLQNIRVFAVNDITTTESHDSKAADVRSIPLGKTVSLLVTPSQAQVVTLASQLGTIRLILRSGEDNDTPAAQEMSVKDMISSSGKGDASKEAPDAIKRETELKLFANLIKNVLDSATKRSSTGSADPAKFKMRVRTGRQATDVVLISNADGGIDGENGTWTATNLPTPSKDDSNAGKAADAPPATDAGPRLPSKFDPGAPHPKAENDAPSPAVKSTKPPIGA